MDLLNATIEDLTVEFVRNKFTSVDLVKAYLRRIIEVLFRSVAEVNLDALRITAEFDKWRQDRTRGYETLLECESELMD